MANTTCRSSEDKNVCFGSNSVGRDIDNFPPWQHGMLDRTVEIGHNRAHLNMRSELITPFDPYKFERVLPLIEAVYGLHEAGQEYAEELKQLSLLIGRVVGKVDVLGAFGSIGADEFAKRLTIDWKAIPGLPQIPRTHPLGAL